MENIPRSLVTSLNELGLSRYEAGVYAALVLYDNAEVKDLVDHLSISKPSVYEALDSLEEKGLAVKRVSKPARYSAISPEMAVELLMDNHRKAADHALSVLKNLEKEKVRTEREEALWTIYGDANIEYKIRDLFGKAKRRISCMIGERYLPFLEKCNIRDIPLKLIVIADIAGLEKKLHELFPGKNADIHVISSGDFFNRPPFTLPEFEEVRDLVRVENTLELIVDDEELLMVPPFFSGSVTVLNTRNRGAILQMKLFGEFTWKQLVAGEEFPGSCPHTRGKEHCAPGTSKKCDRARPE
jgi:HTH-type transcriptional regulator, sugar sensing transcriptional regulator